MRRNAAFVSLPLLLFVLTGATPRGQFRFVIIGDRTGEAVAGVYERVWREAAREHPDFFINVGDTIQGENNATMEAEWMEALALLRPYRRTPIYFTPGNHDIWSPEAKNAYAKYTERPVQYGFDHAQTHFTILDDHSLDPMSPLPPNALSFLLSDLQSHSAEQLKFVFSHRPAWLVPALVRAKDAPLQKVAREYAVRFFIAGHLHQMLHFEVDGVTYLSVPSAGGHLRASKRYEDGWFFGYTVVNVNGEDVDMVIKEIGLPFGRGRVSRLQDWGGSGLAAVKQALPK